jgi:hypothetical protein
MDAQPTQQELTPAWGRRRDETKVLDMLPAFSLLDAWELSK